jgi:hypothetical protein
MKCPMGEDVLALSVQDNLSRTYNLDGCSVEIASLITDLESI